MATFVAEVVKTFEHWGSSKLLTSSATQLDAAIRELPAKNYEDSAGCRQISQRQSARTLNEIREQLDHGYSAAHAYEVIHHDDLEELNRFLYDTQDRAGIDQQPRDTSKRAQNRSIRLCAIGMGGLKRLGIGSNWEIPCFRESSK